MNNLSLRNCKSVIRSSFIVHRSFRRGFTLMEMIVVMGLFLIIITAITAIYAQTTRYGRQVVARAKVQDQVRGTMEAIARAIRVSDIDYNSYPGGTLPAQPMSYLDLINPNDRDYSNIRPSWGIRLEKNPSTVCDLSPCMILSLQNIDMSQLNPRGTQVEDLRFYVSPAKDPFAFDPASGTYASSQQPIVTVYMRVRYMASNPKDQFVVSMQTTVTPRLYLR